VQARNIQKYKIILFISKLIQFTVKTVSILRQHLFILWEFVVVSVTKSDFFKLFNILLKINYI